MIASDPGQGGATWAVLQYVLGFRQLGHEVYVVEPVTQKSIRPQHSTIEGSDNACYFKDVIAHFGLTSSAALLLSGTEQTVGIPYENLRKIARSVDLLVNISGMLTDEALTACIPTRIYLDLDPAFNQLWNAVQKLDMRFGGHTHFFSIGHAIGDASCSVPTCGLNWQKTFQPIVLEQWPVASRITFNSMTTVGNWRGYGSIEHQGVFYGQKAHSLREFLSLPTLTNEKFLLALAIHPAETKDLNALAANGWQLVDPAQVANSPQAYQEFIQGSAAEFGIAKSGYVISRCGWFSDRSVCYLASGRPVIAQETGFSKWLPTGEGLFAFQTMAEILAAIEDMRADYARHASRARAIAEECFDSKKVLYRLLKTADL
jgi:hypothetical protein